MEIPDTCPLWAARLLSCFCLLLLAACGESRPAPTGKAVAGIETRFPLTLGGKTIRVQVAVTELETQKGLMGRRALAADEGMLFVFAQSQQRFFWMRGVPINISLGYFTANGRLDEVKALIAENPVEVPSRSHAIRFVLEMPEAWFEANKVRPGAVLDLAAVRAAIQARGFQQYLDE
ncbi:MAG: DUF192 domain-containing protein [Puniceicoccales bacterium]|jgi:uncharacterized membrane protein (UPF0127 family)|nr:DUF192 domain-containing protein [Puniceicoccales bacterium]